MSVSAGERMLSVTLTDLMYNVQVVVAHSSQIDRRASHCPQIFPLSLLSLWGAPDECKEYGFVAVRKSCIVPLPIALSASRSRWSLDCS